MIGIQEYIKKKQYLVSELKNSQSNSISINKKTSNLFRSRDNSSHKIDVKNFNNVISIDTHNLIAEVEGMCTYEVLVNECLKFNLMPTVVPELKTITIGGASTGIGIESSSFKFGFVHETILEMEVLLSDGSIVLCDDKNNKDLFFGFPNSYGTFGYVLKLKVKLVYVKRFVRLNHIKYSDSKKFFSDLNKFCLQYRDNNLVDFIDGVVFNKDEMYISLASFVDEASSVSDYKFMNIYYKSIQNKDVDYLTTLDYIWRWDYDWFWCSKHFLVQNKFFRLLLGKFMLRSNKYWKIMFFNRKYKLTEKFEKVFGKKYFSESVVQDVEIPVNNAVKFIDFFHKEVGIKPVWICPAMKYNKKNKYYLYETDQDNLYINFGFWDVVKTKEQFPAGYFNKKIESIVKKLHGKKSLYSDSFYDEEEFWELYNGKVYFKLKKKYDSLSKLKNLYQKCVLRK